MRHLHVCSDMVTDYLLLYAVPYILLLGQLKYSESEPDYTVFYRATIRLVRDLQELSFGRNFISLAQRLWQSCPFEVDHSDQISEFRCIALLVYFSISLYFG